MSKYECLFTPLKIGSIESKNRYVMCAMGGPSVMKADGTFNEDWADFYLVRAKGGVGLIIPAVVHLVDMFGRGVWFNHYGDAFVKPMSKAMDKIHGEGSKLFLQITAGMGRVLQVNTQMIKSEVMNADAALVAASPLHNVWDRSIEHRALTKEEIQERVKAFGESARMCKDAGVDGVEIHAVHEGYLLDQFAIESMNSRTDEYGGSLENRLRFTCEIIREIKKQCGEDYPVSVRYSVASKMKGWNQGALPGENYKEFGRSLEESPAAARILVEAGADMLNCDNGTYDSWYWSHPPVYMPIGHNIPECTFIKNYVDVPVICAGRMTDNELNAKLIRENKVDGIGIARPLLADPDFVNKVKADDVADIRPCIGCHVGCMGEVLGARHISCALNPAVMVEKEYEIIKTDSPRRIAIVGGGIGGMEVARIARLRGHEPIILEKSEELGGAFIAAAALSFKENDRLLLDWYRKQMKDLEIEIHFGTEATKESLEALDADVIVFATGSSAKMLPIDGFENTVAAVDVLRGRTDCGEKAIIIGGGLTGCELSYELAAQGKDVTVLEALPEILAAPGIQPPNKTALMDYMNLYGVHVTTNAKIQKISEHSVEVDGSVLPADTIISAVGYNSVLPGELTEAFPGREIHIVGDAKKVGNLMSVIRDAYSVGYAL
ncbi:MAG: FAD-dependent oxidoreductase [Lachnospiraceae bacterium]|nr:FAD-dependent oxidoreductase [Lachnospiraceae bacterium]